MSEELSVLEAIMLEEGDLELFPDAVVAAYRAGPRRWALPGELPYIR